MLFLDELPEFERRVLDALRQPLEEKRVTVARARAHLTYPADFQLIAAMNPCPCGYLSVPGLSCGREPACGQRYASKLSGPLLDRIDLKTTIEPQNLFEKKQKSQRLKAVKQAKRVFRTRKIQQERWGTDWTNATVPFSKLEPFTKLSPSAFNLLDQAQKHWYLSTRGAQKILRVARTLADMEANQTSKNIIWLRP